MSLRGFLGRFRRHELDDAEAFREFVIGVLRERFAGLRVERNDEPLRIRLDANEFGLQNLHAVQQRDHPSREQIREIVVSHFERMFAEMDRTASPAPMYWTDVEPRLRPQIMPAEYAGQAPAPLAFVPLNEDVSIALVVDLENTYSYVRAEDLSLWGVSWDDAYARALANLEAASAAMQLHVSDPPEHFIAVEENDAFAAARLLLPRFRGFLADSLGEPFCAAIPNRDFLICWPAGAAPEFHEAIEAKVAEDYETQPYPLTRAVFVATRTSLA